MFMATADLGMGVQVHATSNRGFTPEELAERALDKIIGISEDADPMIRAQAMAYRDKIRDVLVFYMHEAISSYKTTLYTQSIN